MITLRAFIATLAIAFACVAGSASAQPQPGPRPTIVLVHGAFADSSSWNGVAARLERDGYRVVAAANPLRSVRGDAAYVSAVLNGIEGPVVLVGHSYGGTVITNAANGHPNVEALVYVAGFAPERDESSFGLNGRFPGSVLGEALGPPITLADGGHDLTIRPDQFHAAFAADLPEAAAAVAAIGQRPITDTAGNEASGEPAWRHIPSWSIYGDADRAIPPALLAFMAERAASRHTVVVPGASHVVMISHPREVAALIVEAAGGQ